MQKMTDKTAQKLLGTKDATIACLQDTIAYLEDTILPLKQTIDRLKIDNNFLKHDQEQVRLKGYYLGTVAKTNQDLIQRLLDLNAENKRLEVLVDRLTNRLHPAQDDDDAPTPEQLTMAALAVRDYCNAHIKGQCKGCQFVHEDGGCPFVGTFPVSWPLKF